jgi:hypothetical protein
MNDASATNKTTSIRQPPSLAAACVRLALIMAAAYPIVAFVAWQITQVPVWQTAALAVGVCYLSASLALVLFHFFRLAGNAIAGTLGATLVRIGIPMVAGIAATAGGGKLRDEGFFGLIVVFYLIGLAADTMLSLAMTRGLSDNSGRQSRHG